MVPFQYRKSSLSSVVVINSSIIIVELLNVRKKENLSTWWVVSFYIEYLVLRVNRTKAQWRSIAERKKEIAHKKKRLYILSLSPVGRQTRRRRQRDKGNSTVVREPERAMVRVHPGPFLPGFQFFQKLKRSRDDDFFSSSFLRRRRRYTRRRIRICAVAVVRSTTTKKHDWCLSSSAVSFSLNSLCVVCVSTSALRRFLWLFWRFYVYSHTTHDRHSILMKSQLSTFILSPSIYFKKKATWVFSPKNFQLRRKIRDLLLLSILVQK